MKMKYSPSLILCTSLISHAAVAQERPNFLVCVADDATFEHWSAMGCKWVDTPAFDSVASEGVLYTNCYTPNAKSAHKDVVNGPRSQQKHSAFDRQTAF